MTLSKYLKQRSRQICADNKCTGDHHNCESYAYVDKGCRLPDICAPDFFQGHSGPYAAIALPWTGNQKELESEVRDQCAELEDK